MSPEVYARLRAEVAAAGYAGEIAWSGSIAPVNDADTFGREFVFIVCNSGMKAQIARSIFERVMVAVEAGASAMTVFGHKGKAGAIDRVWHDRARHLAAYLRAGTPAAQLAYLESLPWIGGITKWHLAKNFGLDVAKPDRHLVRVAAAYGLTVDGLCENLAKATGDRIATVDTVIWRACNLGLFVV
ncbi:hypothetical protein [Cupriavidus sp. TMH.W2]|uniref:hypothetical protein n=1 Tax=Cupriavidus sp. TMH.W2 TaxID=3434465 RepID=UPI003D77717E